jgi:tripartite-type tricarboxylate transporter receptor subunit TctC
VLLQPDLAKQLDIEAIEPMPMTSAEFADYAKRDLERWVRLAKEQNINLST